MKFGNNLQHLSIPEWKCYNLDYNELKYQIRLLTQQQQQQQLHQNSSEDDHQPSNSDLEDLHKLFTDNFDYINLFIQTKYGELNRKLHYFQQYFNSIINSEISCTSFLIEIDEIYYQILNLSIILKNLSKFIIIQKIAIKKIFKKFIKYYKYKRQGYKFIYNLKQDLIDNSQSFINFDLSKLTLKLTNFINVLQYEKNKLENLPELNRKNSLFSIASTNNSSEYQNSILPQFTTSQNDFEQNPQSIESQFDLTIYLKKNFQLHALIPNDSYNDILLNFNIYLNLKTLPDSLISYTYLTNNLINEPAIIISIDNFNYSTIIAPIGELRKYSYCILPNEIIKIFINHLNDRNNEEYKSKLFEFFHNSNQLTKKTIDFIVKNNLKPNLKLFCKRKRFIIEQEDQEDYLGTLDSEIYTTNDQSIVNSINSVSNFDQLDYFPQDHLCIYSNDLNLSNFEDSLITEINKDGIIENSHSNFKKFPSKVQSILSNSSVTLFKRLNFYQYQLSCYYNIIPNEEYINNHYTNLLNLNLLKKFEFIDLNNHQLNQEQNIILAKSNNLIQHKLSMQSIQEQQQPIKEENESIKSSIFEFPPNEELSISPNDLFNFDLENENKFINKLMTFKEKWFTTSKTPENPLLYSNYSTYDSINEEPESYLSRNNQQIKYEIEYDQTLSYIYFTLNLVSLFLSGLQLGIIYSIFNNLNEDSQFLIIDNFGIVLILSISMIISILFCLISSNLLHYRNHKPPQFHKFIIYSGFIITVSDCLWGLFLFISKF
ncbi:unnamed protein product [Candida verbasci]|uniref:SPX domain-containing protein n=1 Tax=Candida verbasci TaxID=1227364 RepID=A0A9W4TV15_9ASCO|nr:unnamed protein product [Candida verbasci]